MKRFALLVITLLLVFGSITIAEQETAKQPEPDSSNLIKELNALTVPASFNWEQYTVANLPIPVDSLSFTRPIPASIPEPGVGIKLVKDFNAREKMLLYGYSSDSDSWFGISLFASIGYIKHFLMFNEQPTSFMQLAGLEDLVRAEGRQSIDRFNNEVVAGNPQPSIIGVISPVNNRVPKINASKFSPGDMFFMRLPYEDYKSFVENTTENNKMLIMIGNFNEEVAFMPLPFLTEKPIIDKDSLIFYARVYGIDKVIAEVMLVHTEKWDQSKP